ncbi:uncharacterized protein LOC131930245 [Physella acuta]|uniref:uncharacterized protein LOC131930245 n=1 Tax=Physella acuta TaxID=109671 RepID=UPI0027DD1596|nr:uncharacterized protein LOC131930245 [Physella acuta]
MGDNNVTRVLGASNLQDNISIEVTVLCICRGVISFLGIVSNTLTIRTFLAMGVKDGVTLAFLYLSVSDQLYLVTITVASISYIFQIIELISSFRLYFPIDPYGINTFFINIGGGFFANTILTITFLSITRCLSVAKPLWFRKKLSSKKWTVIFMLTSGTSCVLSVIPILAYMGIIQSYDFRIHTVRAMLWISPYRKWVTYIIWPIRDTFMPIAIQVILVICAIVMKRHLIKASSFRQQHTRLDETSIANDMNNYNIKDTKLKGKELHIIQQLLVLSVIFIISSLPKVVHHTTKLVLAEYALDGRYGRIYESMSVIKDTCQMIYSCSNIFVYYKYNSKFRSLLWKK